MTFRRLPFPEMQWTPGNHALERKKFDGSVALLQFGVGFEDPNWCVRGHTIYVVSGVLEMVLGNSVERVATGEACVVTAGTAHRARNAGDRDLLLFVVSDAAS